MRHKSLMRKILGCALIAVALEPLSAQERPQSIILIVADGTGIGQHTWAYYHQDTYAPAAFEHVGLMATHPSDKTKVTDSAAAATAFSAGIKTYNGAIAVDDNRQPVKTVLEYARDLGMSTGLVATSTITHATPAAFAAHVESRDEYAAIAREMAASQVTVMFGGGRNDFLAKSSGGKQSADLFKVLAARGVQVVSRLDEPVDDSKPVVGLFADGALPPAYKGREPSTTAMALRALEILDLDPDGFFLMVEESQVDWASHDQNLSYVDGEMASLNQLVAELLAYQSAHPQVLVVLVPDHETGGLAVQGKIVGKGLKAAWTTKGHTGNLVPIFATGPGSAVFNAVVDNTFIGQTLIRYITAR